MTAALVPVSARLRLDLRWRWRSLATLPARRAARLRVGDVLRAE